jgi:hypothetical protein
VQEYLFFQLNHSTFPGVCHDRRESFGPHPCPLPNFAALLVEMPAGEGIGMSKNRSNVEKHPFDLFFADSRKMSELMPEDQRTDHPFFLWGSKIC